MIPDAPDGSALERVYEALDAAGSEYQSGQDWTCPYHGDNTASLGVTQGDKGVIIKCQAGCSTKEVLSAIGLKLSDLFDKEASPSKSGKRRSGNDNARVVQRTTYTYKNAAGKVVRLVTRADLDNGKKRITQKVIDKAPVLYRLPGLRKAIAAGAIPVLCEGEKSVITYSQVCEKNHYPTTAPMGAKWLEAYTKQLRGASKVIIIADNDDTGFRYALAALESLGKAGIEVEVFVTATEEKHDDIVDHLAAGFTLAELVRLDARSLRCILAEPGEKLGSALGGDDATTNLWPSPVEPLACARKFIAERYTVDGKPTLRRWRESFYVWNGKSWSEISDEQIRVYLYERLEHAYFISGSENPTRTSWKPTKTRVSQVIDCLMAGTFVDPEIEHNSFLDGRTSDNMIAFTNGILNYETLEFIDPSPDFFNLSALPYPYDMNAPEPTVWLRFLKSLWRDDPKSVQLLQEYFGYLVSGSNKLEKFLLIVGPPRSGKSTISRVATALVGQENTVAKGLNTLGEGFNMAPYIGKTLATPGDVRIESRHRPQVIQSLLEITGNDMQTISRKFKGDWTGTLGARFLIATNEIPDLRENSGALIARTLLLQTENSYVGREDRELFTKITAELPGVLRWALEGLSRLLERGEFVTVESNQAAIQEMLELSSPISAFWHEKIEYEIDSFLPIDEAYEGYREWCMNNGYTFVPNKQQFGRDVKAAKGLSVTQARIGKMRTRGYRSHKLMSKSEKRISVTVGKS